MRNLRAVWAVLLLTAAGCSLDYRSTEESEALRESVPDLVFSQFTHVSVNGDKVVFRLEAGEAQLFNKKKMTVLSNVIFTEYTDSGEASITGKAKRAVFHTDTENAELSGDVYGYSAADQVGFYAQNLVWLKDERVLKSTGLETVRIKKDDGSYIQGVYFTIDARRKSLTFDAAVRGRYFHDDKTNND
jgi:LPS export ABC transporter protein LptC